MNIIFWKKFITYFLLIIGILGFFVALPILLILSIEADGWQNISIGVYVLLMIVFGSVVLAYFDS